MPQHPGFVLRICLVEVEEKRGVRQLLEPGGVVRHDVERPWEVVGRVAVAVLTLVEASVVAQVGSWPLGRDGPFCDARDSWSVVRHIGDCHVGDVVVVGYDGDLPQEPGVLQVAVVSLPGGVLS